jgi:hypothetical protein
MATTDPANVYALPLQGVEGDPMTRPRGSGAFLVTLAGNAVVSAEGRGRRIAIRPEVEPAVLRTAISALVAHLSSPHGATRGHDVVVETINAEPAGISDWAPLLRDAGFKNEGRSLRFYAAIP